MAPSLAKLSRSVHWISSAFGLVCLIFFSITGITLNHPSWFEVKKTSSHELRVVSEQWLSQFQQLDDGEAQLSQLLSLVDQYWSLPFPHSIESDSYDWVFHYQHPGAYSSVILDIESQSLTYEQHNDGVVALINDLHKGRHSGGLWSLFIDLAAVLMLLFALSGLLLLQVYAAKRKATWLYVLAGFFFPLVIYIVGVP